MTYSQEVKKYAIKILSLGCSTNATQSKVYDKFNITIPQRTIRHWRNDNNITTKLNEGKKQLVRLKPTNWRQFFKDLEEVEGSITELARRLDVDESTVRYWRDKFSKERDEFDRRSRDGDYSHKTYILTSAQINTPVHNEFFSNVELLAKDIGAEIIVSGLTYNKNSDFSGGMGDPDKLLDSHNFDERVRPYLCNDTFKLNNNITWLGAMNILPTAKNPLTGLTTITGESSCVVPHTKISLESVATRPSKDAKLCMTTGTVTVENYIQKKAGQVAELHHSLAALIVEIVDNDLFHYRHISATSDGAFYDLTNYYNGKVTRGHRSEAIIYGDIHQIDIDKECESATWGNNSLSDILKPKKQVLHDVLDGFRRNSHNLNDTLWMKAHCNDLLEDEVDECIDWINNISMEDSEVVVVRSNHDTQLDRWANNCSHHDEPNIQNAIFMLKLQLMIHEAAEAGKYVDIFPELFRRKGFNTPVRFLKKDESFTINGIECGEHGDSGASGSRGTPRGFSKQGVKTVTGHTHQAAIIDGSYVVGCMRTLNADYCKGASGWSHTNCIIYPNGKRTLITMAGGEYFSTKVKKARL